MSDRGNKKELLSENQQCELCGSKRSLEVHHIVPQMTSCVYGYDLIENRDNMIVLCGTCHAKLTPKNILIRGGMKIANSVIVNRKKNQIIDKNQFYEKAMEIFEEYGTSINAAQVFDMVDEIVGW